MIELGLKYGHKYHGVMPSILDQIVKEGLEINRNNHRGFEKQLSSLCATFFLCGNKLLTLGINKRKTHPFCKVYADNLKVTIHAEIDGLLKLNKMNKLNYVTDIVCIRGCKNLCDSHPCNICSGILNMYFNKVRLWYFHNNNWEMEVI